MQEKDIRNKSMNFNFPYKQNFSLLVLFFFFIPIAMMRYTIIKNALLINYYNN
jgi:hypothetical protein